MKLKHSFWNFAGLFVLVLSGGRFLQTLIQEASRYQWDTKVYYEAPLLWSQGQNPYVAANFVYPPLWLLGLEPFALAVSYGTYYFGFIALKLLSLAGIAWALRRLFPKVPFILIALLIWLGFHGSLFLDLRAGNIGIFEGLVISWAAVCLTKKKWMQYAGLVLFISTFKLSPILFLGVLFVVAEHKKARMAFAAGVAGFALFLLVNRIFFADEWRDFVSAALNRVGEAGLVAPSLYSLLKEVLTNGMNRIHLPGASVLVPLIFAICVGLISYLSFRRVQKSKDLLFQFSVTATVYALAVPRMKDYAYGVMLVPALFVIPSLREVHARYLFWFFILMAGTIQTIPPLFSPTVYYFWNYLPVFQTLFIWGLLVTEKKQSG